MRVTVRSHVDVIDELGDDAFGQHGCGFRIRRPAADVDQRCSTLVGHGKIALERLRPVFQGESGEIDAMLFGQVLECGTEHSIAHHIPLISGHELKDVIHSMRRSRSGELTMIGFALHDVDLREGVVEPCGSQVIRHPQCGTNRQCGRQRATTDSRRMQKPNHPSDHVGRVQAGSRRWLLDVRIHQPTFLVGLE